MSLVNLFRRKRKPRWSFLAGRLRKGEPAKVIRFPIERRLYSTRRSMQNGAA